MNIELTLTGTKALLMHNGRLSNPIDPHTQALKQLTAKRKKTDEDLIEIMRCEARGAAYETDDGLLGFPTQNVWRCIYDAAKAYKRGEDIKRALSFNPIVEPLAVNGEHVKVEDFLYSDPNRTILYVPVSVNRAKTMRARPQIHNWALTASFDLLEDVLDPRDLLPVLERAGRLVGLGDWRPIYGTFEAEVTG